MVGQGSKQAIALFMFHVSELVLLRPSDDFFACKTYIVVQQRQFISYVKYFNPSHTTLALIRLAILLSFPAFPSSPLTSR